MNGQRTAARVFRASVCCVVFLLCGCSRQQSDWQKTREENTTDAYELFLKKYPTGEFSAQAEARVKELYEERDWQKARDADTPEAYAAFLKQYPDGKWTEEARIRVENFSLAQAPGSGAPAAATPATAADSSGVASAAAGNSPPATTPPVPTSPVTAPPKAAATAGVKSPAGSYAVQLGAFKSGASAAHHRWEHLQKEYPKLLAGLSSKVVPKQTASGTLYRLQATGLTESHARAICGSLTAKSQACVIVPPA